MTRRTAVVAVGKVAAVRVRPGRSRAGRVAPVPSGPGRPVPPRSRRASAPPSVGSRCSAAPQSVVRSIAGRSCSAPAARWRVSTGGWRELAGWVALAVASALVVSGVGALAEVVRVARVPAATGAVVVRADESLWQVARRAAPSAEPDAVVRRIVELNDLGSPSVEAGRVLVSPIG